MTLFVLNPCQRILKPPSAARLVMRNFFLLQTDSICIFRAQPM